MNNDDEGAELMSIAALAEYFSAQIAAHRQFVFLLMRQVAIDLPAFDEEAFLDAAERYQHRLPTPQGTTEDAQQRLRTFALQEYGRLIGAAERGFASARDQIDGEQDG